MKILLSAYACEPNKGSEPEVGWRWALELARLGHEVWVLTRENNRTSIEAGLARQNPLPNLHFAYYDLPPWLRWWKRGARGVHLYYRLWQWGVYSLARNLHHQHGFDRAHHVTFVSLRHPTILRRLGVPFVFGPVAGGERVPWRLRQGMGLRGWLIEVVRDVSNLAVRLDPFVRATLRAAEAVYVTSRETRRLVPGSVQEKVRVELGFGIDGVADNTRHCGDALAKFLLLTVFFLGGLFTWMEEPAYVLFVVSLPRASVSGAVFRIHERRDGSYQASTGAFLNPQVECVFPDKQSAIAGTTVGRHIVHPGQQPAGGIHKRKSGGFGSGHAAPDELPRRHGFSR